MRVKGFSLASIRVLAASSIGGGLEIYDFIIYILFSNIIATLFFPKGNHYVSLLATFGIFAIGYFMRPIGGIIFGYLGDKSGRKKWLLWSIVMMGSATVLIGCLPSYQQVGIVAPILLTVLRLVQGLAIGGDLPGGVTYVSENSASHSRGLNCSIVFCGVNIGLLLASGVGTLITSLLTHEQLYSWGWRIGFWFGLVLIILGLYLRLGLAESAVFLAAKKAQRLVKNPFKTLMHKELFPGVVVGIGFAWLFSILIMQVFTKLPDYLHSNIQWLSMDKALLLNTISIAIFACLIPIMGYMSDRIGRKRMLLIASGLWVICGYPLYKLLLADNFSQIILVLFIIDILGAMVIGAVPAALTELFTSTTRYSGVAFTYNISFAIFGGLTPLLLTWLSHQVTDQAWQSLNIIIAAVVCFIGALIFKN